MIRNMRTTRRQFLKTASAIAAGCGFSAVTPTSVCYSSEVHATARPITHGPNHHWFGYYDKLEFDATGRYVLGMEVDFEGRSPRPDDVIRIGMVDLKEDDRWVELGQSTAWCWQQGCMLQWRPGSQNEILWNDRENDRYVCRLLDLKTGAKRTIPHPVYCVSPDGQWAIAPDFRRLGDTRPGYGYNGIPDPNSNVPAPKDTGVFRIDMNTGERKLLISVADIARLPYPNSDLSNAKHWFNHLLVNTDGSRFTFLHRWSGSGRSWGTRMLTAASDGSDVRVLNDSGFMSHFIWRDPSHILAYCQTYPQSKRGFFLLRDGTDQRAEPIAEGVVASDGHCSYSPDGRWILYDTYPDKERNQHLYLYDIAHRRRIEIGAFQSPRQYKGEWRCDLHPRFSRDGRQVVIDSPHGGEGRQLYLIDVADIIQ